MAVVPFILSCLYFMLPAYVANMMPIFTRRVPFLDMPVDLGKTLRGNRIFGSHKTYRGILAGTLGGILVAYMQHLAMGVRFFAGISIVDYQAWLSLGFLMGLGALLGDLVKSFFKRRLGVRPGARFMPFDQLDFVIGALVFAMPVYAVSVPRGLAIMALSFLLHVIVRQIGFYTHVNKERW